MADVISNIVTDKQDIKNQLGNVPDVLPVVKRFNNKLALRRLFSKQFFLELGDSFALGSATNGVLGTNMLGDRRIEVASRVFPHKGVVEEDFVDVTFINTDSSTGTINTSLETYTIDGSELLLSKTVSKTGDPINNVMLSGLTYTGDAPVVELSNDGGTTFSVVTLNSLHTFPASLETDELVYKVTSTGNTVIESPFKIQVNKG